MTREERKRMTFLSIAHELSALGTCNRAHVGAVIVRDGRCISWGYNGAPPGLPHCDVVGHGWDNKLYGKKILVAGELLDVKEIELYDPTAPDYQDDPVLQIQQRAVSRYGCLNATHAEANALAYAARQGISTAGGTLYVTLSPCINCARLLIAAGIRAVEYDQEYRDKSGIELFLQLGGEISG